jgi:ABC-type Zn uptake system ZnuABC Zn-binding protein ZnuA
MTGKEKLKMYSHRNLFFIIVSSLLGVVGTGGNAAHAKKLRVITTISSYAPIAAYIGGNKVEVSHIIKGYQDPHIVRPKPSLALELSKADVLVATGLDLEAWLPALMDASGNSKIMSGQPGYVAASSGLQIQEKPASLDRSEGDVHVFGNPHIHTSPLNGKIIAENITVGLSKVAPEDTAFFQANLKKFKEETDRRLFGEPLIRILGSKTLCALAEKGRLHTFLEEKKYQGKPLISLLGGWMKQGLPLRGEKVVTYHKNWGYFTNLMGIEVVGYMEPKPGIPPSPGHVIKLIEKIKRERIRLMLAANYFDSAKVKLTAEKAGATPVIMALSAGGEPGMNTFFDQFDIWIRKLVSGLKQTAQKK